MNVLVFGTRLVQWTVDGYGFVVDRKCVLELCHPVA